MRSKQRDEFGGTVNDVALRQGQTMSQRDPSKECNQLRPTSLRSSGQELDEGCEITQASATDAMLKGDK
jgi:hypothetical protein